jgi:hypothetical protein
MVNNMEKYNAVLKEYYDKIPFENRILYDELAKRAIDIGYVPIGDKTKSISISFRNNKTKYKIMKFAEERKDEYIWKFKFSANKNYSNIFEESIKYYNKELRDKYSEKYNFKENITCFGCRKCINSKKLFYKIEYDAGKKYAVRGSVSFVHINQISKEIVEEAGKMMKIEHERLCEE